MTVAAYDVSGTTVMVPQRVEPEREAEAGAPQAPKPATYYAPDGGTEFRKMADAQSEGKRALLLPLIDWAVALEDQHLARLYSFIGPTHSTLLPRLIGEEAGPFTIWENGTVSAFRTVLARRSPHALTILDERLGKPVGKGTMVQPLDGPMLTLMRSAFEEAAGH